MADFGTLLSIVEEHKQKVSVLDTKVRTKAADTFRESLKAVADYVAQVAKNNPTSTIDDILARPDVAQAFYEQSRKAQDLVDIQIRKAYSDGARVGRSQIDAELKHLGLQADYPDLDTSMYVEHLTADLNRNFALLSQNVQNSFRNAYSTVPEQGFIRDENARLETVRMRVAKAITDATKTSKTLSHRASAGATVALSRGFTDQQLAAYAVLHDQYPDWQIKKVWTANFVGNTPCPTCAALHGTTIGMSEVFSSTQTFAKKPPKVYQDLQGPPRHPNCFPAGTLVTTSSEVVGTSTRFWEGELVELVTSEGATLSGTPNHPILTTQGWVALGELQLGMEVIRYSNSDLSVLSGQPQDNDPPALIEDVVEAFSRTNGVFRSEVPLTAPNFHGDSVEGEVAVIRSYGGLPVEVNSLFCEEHCQSSFSNGRMMESSLVGASLCQPSLQGSSASPVSDVGSLSKGCTAFEGAVLISKVSGSTFTTLLNSIFIQQVSDDITTNVELSSQRQNRFSQEEMTINDFILSSPDFTQCGILGADSILTKNLVDRSSTDTHTFGNSLDRFSPVHMTMDDFVGCVPDVITSLHRVPYAGRVYNLETVDGWYGANGIISHNCKCRLVLTIEKVAPLVPLDATQKPKPGRPSNPTANFTDVQPAGMRRYARQQAKNLPETPHGISSQDIRDLSEPDFLDLVSSTVQKIVKWFKRVLHV